MKNIILFIIIFSLFQSVYAQDSLKFKLDSLVDDFYPNKNDPGVILQVYANDNKVIFSKGQGITALKTGNRIDSKTNFRMASVSKQFTAAAIYKLSRAKKLDIIHTKLREFFPNLNGEIRNSNIFSLLNHTSGVIDYEGLIPDNQKKQLSDLDVLKLIEPIDSAYFQPGTQFRYSNTGYCLLALIVEKVSGRNISAFMKSVYFAPLKMTNSLVYFPTDQIKDRAYGYHLNEGNFAFADQSITSATKGDGGVYTSAGEYMLWNQAYFLDLKQDSLFSLFLLSNFKAINEDVSYAVGKFVSSDQYGNLVFFHSGESTGFNNFILSIPSRDINIILFSNRDDQTIVPFIDEVLKELEIRVKGLDGKPIFIWLSDVYANQN